jgi:hypothetical protein
MSNRLEGSQGGENGGLTLATGGVGSGVGGLSLLGAPILHRPLLPGPAPLARFSPLDQPLPLPLSFRLPLPFSFPLLLARFLFCRRVSTGGHLSLMALLPAPRRGLAIIGRGGRGGGGHAARVLRLLLLAAGLGLRPGAVLARRAPCPRLEAPPFPPAAPPPAMAVPVAVASPVLRRRAAVAVALPAAARARARGAAVGSGRALDLVLRLGPPVLTVPPEDQDERPGTSQKQGSDPLPRATRGGRRQRTVRCCPAAP